MRRLEESVHDILSGLITGGITKIPTDCHGVFAARLALIIMVASLSKDEADVVSAAEREELRLHLLPPKDWQIFVCRSDCTIEEGQYYYSDGFIGDAMTPTNTVVSIKAHVTTFILGKLCVHAMSKRAVTGYSGINIAQVWPTPVTDIEMEATSILTPTKVYELSSVARRHGFSSS